MVSERQCIEAAPSVDTMHPPPSIMENTHHSAQELVMTEHAQSFSCQICTNVLLPDRKFVNQIFCSHPFCVNCIIKYITLNLENIFRVPAWIATSKLAKSHVVFLLDPISSRDLVGPELFVKWGDVLCRSSVSVFPHCYRPNQKCGALVLDTCGEKLSAQYVPVVRKVFAFAA
ncbi:PREDICTED: uncharacterized protein LOC109213100 [Nicotiana attenuata]|uniref:uncharacterized protein LOC109213100 n=1 Tax=Nicotiana attenuata TaxID=49451 RepID=UPI000904B8B5|nr:PREDICTED: uncharacterized protein LOC109213100 [Nicotiana attenuata]